MHEPNTGCLFPPKSSIYQGGALPYNYPYQELLYHRRPIFAVFEGTPPKISLFSPNRIGERPLEIIVTQGTTQIFEIYPFIKFPGTDMTTRYPQSPAIEDLSVIYWRQGTADRCAPPLPASKIVIWDPVRAAQGTRKNISSCAPLFSARSVLLYMPHLLISLLLWC